jgi:hypothetical protein
MLDAPILHVGTRVRIIGPQQALGVTLDTPYGTVVAPDEYSGYYLVRLDAPATYHYADGRTEQIDEVREFWDNLEIVGPTR